MKQPSMSMHRIIIPGMIGNILEWYDFSLYGYFAAVISSLFFPTDNSTLGLIKTFGVFAVGFLMRPVGAIVFGHFGDRYGRKKTLAASVILMALSTVIIGLLPTHAQIGAWAGVLLMICRLFQGLAIGGEFSGSIVYMLEHSDENKRGLYGSFAMFSAFTGLLLGSIVGAVVSSFSEGTQYAEMAWRIPFLFGVVIGGVGLYLRLRMPETPRFVEVEKSGAIVKHPFIASLREYPIEMLKGTLLDFLPAMGFYLCFVYLTSYFSLYLKLPLHNALIINSISMAMILVFIPFFGMLSDRFGRKPILGIGALLAVIFSYPLFLLIERGTYTAVLSAQIGFAFIISFCYSAIPAALVEMFSTRLRYTAMSFPYNLANTIFGGTAPLVATYLIKITGTIIAPSYYLIFAGVVMLLTIFTLKETYKKPLD